MNEPRLLKLPEVMHLTALSRSQIYRLIRAELFPSPVELGARAVAWRESEVIAWIQERIRRSVNPRRESSLEKAARLACDLLQEAGA